MIQQEADYVIVGGGSAGCVMAARLSEDPATKVILLEAGGEDKNMWIHIPLGFGKTFADRRVNWCYETEPDPGAGGRKIFWPRGKVLGGSSSINGMVYIRGQHEDFDHWRQLGNSGWSAVDVLPYFKRAEHQTRAARSCRNQPMPRITIVRWSFGVERTMRGTTVAPCFIQPARAKWAPTGWPLSVRNFGSMAWRDCAWSTHRSCRQWSPATPTPRRS